MSGLGFYGGRHFSDGVETVKVLKREGRRGEAIDLLLHLDTAVEGESRVIGCGAAPLYFEQLAILYSKAQDTESEVAILEHYAALPQAPRLGSAG